MLLLEAEEVGEGVVDSDDVPLTVLLTPALPSPATMIFFTILKLFPDGTSFRMYVITYPPGGNGEDCPTLNLANISVF